MYTFLTDCSCWGSMIRTHRFCLLCKQLFMNMMQQKSSNLPLSLRHLYHHLKWRSYHISELPACLYPAGLSLTGLPALKAIKLDNSSVNSLDSEWPHAQAIEICSLEVLRTNSTLLWLSENAMFHVLLSQLQTLALPFDNSLILASLCPGVPTMRARESRAVWLPMSMTRVWIWNWASETVSGNLCDQWGLQELLQPFHTNTHLKRPAMLNECVESVV